MIPFLARERLGHLTAISRHFAYMTFDHKVGEKDKLSLSSEISSLSYNLHIPEILYPILREISSPNLPISMSLWETATKKYINEDFRVDAQKKKDFDGWVTVPKYLEQSKIWENKRVEYWRNVVLNLAWVWSLPPFQQKRISWQVITDFLVLNISGGTNITNVSTIIIEGIEQPFWGLDIQPDLLQQSVKAVNITLLIAQFLALQGHGSLTVDHQKNKFAMQLKIPRADTGSSVREYWPLGPEQCEQFFNELANMTAQEMVKYCLMLEEALLQEINRLSIETGGKVRLKIVKNQVQRNKNDDEVNRVNEVLNKAFNDLQFGKRLLKEWEDGHNPFNSLSQR